MLTGLPARGLRRNCNASGSHATKQYALHALDAA